MELKFDDVEEIVKKDADSRGRVHLGPDYADKTVKVAIVEVSEQEEITDA